MTGVVIRVTGSWHDIRLDDGTVLPSRIIGRLRLDDIRTTNPVGVGDRVEVIFEQDQPGQGVITEVLPRRNYVVRQSPRKKHELHLLAANVDQAILVTTIIRPSLKMGFIDRFLLMTEPHDIPVTIVINKNDLFGESEAEIFGGLQHVYASIGYGVISVSATTGDGLPALRAIMKDKVSLIAGQSGVGKSSLINAIQPGLELRTDKISEYSGKGTHTTTFAEMFALDMGGFIIDTPGIKMLSFNNLEPMDVAHNFREFFALSPECRFPSCLHREEPGCAVKAAVEAGEISLTRYETYLQVLGEIEDQNYWERHKKM